MLLYQREKTPGWRLQMMRKGTAGNTSQGRWSRTESICVAYGGRRNAAVNVTLVSVADQLDEQAAHVSQYASLMHASASYPRRAGPVIRAARLFVMNPAWAGVCDEDVLLEQELADAGWLAADGERLQP